jgi:hypothetical protein
MLFLRCPFPTYETLVFVAMSVRFSVGGAFRYPSRKRLEPHQSEKVDLTALICVHLDSSLLLVNLPSYSCALRTYLFAANACFDGWALNHGVNSHEHFMKVQR